MLSEQQFGVTKYCGFRINISDISSNYKPMVLNFYGVPRDFAGMLLWKRVKFNGVLRFVN